MFVVNSRFIPAASGVIFYSSFPKASGSAICVSEEVVSQKDQKDQSVNQTPRSNDSERSIQDHLDEFVRAMESRSNDQLVTKGAPVKSVQRVSGVSGFGTNPISSLGLYAQIINTVRTNPAFRNFRQASSDSGQKNIVRWIVDKHLSANAETGVVHHLDEANSRTLKKLLEKDGHGKLLAELFADKVNGLKSVAMENLRLMRKEFFPLFREQVLYDLRSSNIVSDTFSSKDAETEAILVAYQNRLEETMKLAWMLVELKSHYAERQRRSSMMLKIGDSMLGSRPNDRASLSEAEDGDLQKKSVGVESRLWLRIKKRLANLRKRILMK